MKICSILQALNYWSLFLLGFVSRFITLCNLEWLQLQFREQAILRSPFMFGGHSTILGCYKYQFIVDIFVKLGRPFMQIYSAKFHTTVLTNSHCSPISPIHT